ncbi:hypothetical protein [Brevibacterium album]|uniref:hypothetical protein n=1 Tax=Brevibacterium album TaxID=417948 RepID=UPI0004011E82|nr:hypothetical protein [Brevibacterium album]
MKKRPVRTALALTALAAIVPLSGCAALLSAQQTASYEYNGGDGAWATLDGVDVRGLVLVQNDEGDAQMFFTLINSTDEPREVSIDAGAGAPVDVSLAANAVHEQNPAGAEASAQTPQEQAAVPEPVNIEGLDVVAGSQIPVEVTVGSETQEVRVQVLNSELPYFEGLEPTSGATEAPAEGEQATEGETGTTQGGAAEGTGTQG